MRSSVIILPVFLCLFTSSCTEQLPQKEIPHLKKNGNATQLIVDGNPFLILGGELHNSSSSSREYMSKYWPGLKASGMNTVLAAVEWSLIEPVEGSFDFTVVDNLIADARNNHLRLILLWFGSWKNGQTHYAPGWVKKDYLRFPRVKTENGKSLEILSVFGKESLKADSRALAAMMQHIKEIDKSERTVLMIQVENEVGILGSPRDYSEIANADFAGNVPARLMEYLIKNRQSLDTMLLETWKAAGSKTTGSWEEIFGKGVRCDEYFMAWNYARYIDSCTAAAKAEYPIPMYVNAWIVQPQDKKPGDYPSGGPQAHVLDIWKAAASNIDLFCPDIYLPYFESICKLYTINDNTLFIPEARAGQTGAGQLFLAIGKYKSMGYSPFGYESRNPGGENDPMTKAYKLLSGLAPVILEAQGRNEITSVLLKKGKNESEEPILGNYKMLVELAENRRTLTGSEDGFGIFICSGPDEYLVYGNNIRVSFSPNTPGPPIAAILQVDEGVFENGKWIGGRRLNGDDIFIDIDLAKKINENKTGTGLNFGPDNNMIQRVRLYRYE
jgi:hypothetical protein